MGFVIPAIAALSAGAGVGIQASQASKARKEAKNAQNDQIAANAKAASELQKAQEQASNQAVASIARRRASMTQTVFTNPLGIGGMANTARKTLLGQ